MVTINQYKYRINPRHLLGERVTENKSFHTLVFIVDMWYFSH